MGQAQSWAANNYNYYFPTAEFDRARQILESGAPSQVLEELIDGLSPQTALQIMNYFANTPIGPWVHHEILQRILKLVRRDLLWGYSPDYGMVMGNPWVVPVEQEYPGMVAGVLADGGLIAALEDILRRWARGHCRYHDVNGEPAHLIIALVPYVQLPGQVPFLLHICLGRRGPGPRGFM
jgi:hypothetical protein